jgi:hypothetical protein
MALLTQNTIQQILQKENLGWVKIGFDSWDNSHLNKIRVNENREVIFHSHFKISTKCNSGNFRGLSCNETSSFRHIFKLCSTVSTHKSRNFSCCRTLLLMPAVTIAHSACMHFASIFTMKSIAFWVSTFCRVFYIDFATSFPLFLILSHISD